MLQISEAVGDAARSRLISNAEAASIAAIGQAEAEGMRLKATAYKQYSQAAILSLVCQALPVFAGKCTISKCATL